MKIIDLLDKIAKGEDIPKRIKFRDQKLEYINGVDYIDENGNYLFNNKCCIDVLDLNEEVLIIEKEPKTPKKIEKEEIETSMAIGEQICANKINEIIDYLKSKGE